MAKDGSPDFGTGVIFDIFQSSGTTPWDREQLNKVVSVGEIDLAVPRSIALEMPSGPLAVFALQVDSRWKTSSSEHVMLERVGPLAHSADCWVCKDELGLKHEAKNLLSRSDFPKELLAFSD